MPIVIVLVLALPLSTPAAWKVLSYRGIPGNAVAFGADGLGIAVNRSAGPVVHRLAEPRVVTGIRASGVVTGQLETTADRQGETGADDFVLRIGLVEAGSRRPTFLQRRLAPSWVRELFALAPPGSGVAQIRFFNLGLASSQIGWTRRHPLSDLVLEEIVAAPGEDGRFEVDARFAPITVLGVWLAADGDDTGSRFHVRLEGLSLVTAAP